MTIAIVAEKPSIAREIAPFARRHWPDKQIILLSAVPYGTNYRMEYPRGLAWADYPRVAEPVIRVERMGASWRPMLVDGLGGLHPCEVEPSFLERASIIVNACDPDHTGAMAFALLMEDTFGADALQKRSFLSLYLMAMDEDSMVKAFAGMSDFSESCAPRLSYGRVKRYFDFNWNVNALAILGATARAAGLPAGAPPLSKYAVQLLLWLAQRDQTLNEGQIIRQMNNWVGTGRYTTPAEIGSCASRPKISEDLEANGLLQRVHLGSPTVLDRTQVTVTELGQQYLALLHKDMRDLDLPFRLDAWGQQGLASAKPAIDRYIRTVFGKQKRFLDARRSAS